MRRRDYLKQGRDNRLSWLRARNLHRGDLLLGLKDVLPRKSASSKGQKNQKTQVSLADIY